MKTIALLTGKGGSLLKNKNVLKLNKKKILDYPCIAAKKIKDINGFFASSEDKLILKAAKKNGFKPILRPKKYSRKNSQHLDVLIHALKHLEKYKIYPDILVVLLANSPTIKSSWIKKSINILKKNKKITSVVPVEKNNDFHPLRAKKISNQFLKPYIKPKKKISTNRQDLESNYFLCHNFWTIRVDAITSDKGELPWKFLGKNCYPLIVKNSIDIHDDKDLIIAKYLINKFY
jgi:CMP-N,N'-diacetyllegionaminic acid synthase